MISSGTSIDGSFDASINYLNLNTTSSLIDYSSIKFKDNVIGVNSHSNGIDFTYKAKSINITDSLSFKNPNFLFTANDKTTNFNLNWNNLLKPNNAGIIEGTVVFDNSRATILFDKIKYTIEDSIWRVVKSNPIIIDSMFTVDVKPLTFYNQNQLVTIEGKLSKNSSDKLDVYIQNFKLAQLNPFLKDAKLTLDGSLTGNTSILGVFGKAVATSDINFAELKLNNKLIGNGEIKSEYTPEKDFVSINGFSAFAKDFDGNLLKNIEFSGFYYPKKKEDNLDNFVNPNNPINQIDKLTNIQDNKQIHIASGNSILFNFFL